MTDTKMRRMAIEPLDDHILIRATTGPTTTPGGIVIPDTAQPKPTEGVVIACGPGKRNTNGERMGMSVEPGQRVMVTRDAGMKVDVEGVEHRLVREVDVVCVMAQSKE